MFETMPSGWGQEETPSLASFIPGFTVELYTLDIMAVAVVFDSLYNFYTSFLLLSLIFGNGIEFFNEWWGWWSTSKFVCCCLNW